MKASGAKVSMSKPVKKLPSVKVFYDKIGDFDFAIIGEKEFKPEHSENSSPTCRYVFRYKNFAIKVDAATSTVWHNEYRVWKKIDPKDRRYFVPCYKKGKNYSISKWVNFKEDTTVKTCKKVHDLILKYGLEDVDSDWRETKDPFSYGRNWGLKKNGHPVIYDYGARYD